MIVPVMAISNLVLTQQIYSEETNGAHAHYSEPVPLSVLINGVSVLSGLNLEEKWGLRGLTVPKKFNLKGNTTEISATDLKVRETNNILL